MSGTPVTLLYQLPPSHQIFGAWQLSAEGFVPSEDQPVYLSFDVGLGNLKTSDIALWHYDGGTWTPFETDVFTYDGQHANFLAESFSAYAVSAVPEPGTLVLLLAAALAGVIWQWRRGRATAEALRLVRFTIFDQTSIRRGPPEGASLEGFSDGPQDVSVCQ